jgi:head-tail adaptor
MKWSCIVSGAAALVALAVLVVWRSSQAIRSASEDVRAERELRFVSRTYVTAAWRMAFLSAEISPALFTCGIPFSCI